VAETTEGPIWTGKLHWTGESDRSIREALQQAAETAGCNRTTVGEAGDWLQDYLASHGGSADSAALKRDGVKAGHSKDAIQRARTKLRIRTVSIGFPRRTHWVLQLSRQSSDVPGETTTIQTTQTTAANRRIPETQSLQSSESSQSLETPREGATIDSALPSLDNDASGTEKRTVSRLRVQI
jgi:hypothetical protein